MSTHLNSFDMKTYNELKDFMGGKFSEFLKSYIETMQTYIDNAGPALTQKDYETVRSNVHPIQSTSLALGAFKLAHIAQGIEEAIELSLENGKTLNFDELTHEYKNIVNEYESVKSFIQNDMS